MEYVSIGSDLSHGPYHFPQLRSIHASAFPSLYNTYWPTLGSSLGSGSFPALRRLEIEEPDFDVDEYESNGWDFKGQTVPWNSLVAQLTHLRAPIISLTDLAFQLARSTSLESIIVSARAREYTGLTDPTSTFIDGLRKNVNLHTFHYYERHSRRQSDDYWHAVTKRLEKIRDFISDSDHLKFLSLHIEDAGSRPVWIKLKKEIRSICTEKGIQMVMLRSSRRGWGDDLTDILSFADLASQLAGSTSLELINVAAKAREYTELDDPTAMFIDGLRNNFNLNTLHYYERHDSGESEEYWNAVIKRHKQIRDYIRHSEELRLLSLRVERAGYRPGWIELKKEIRIICERKGIKIVVCRPFHRGYGEELIYEEYISHSQRTGRFDYFPSFISNFIRNIFHWH
jgi:hypothetical protein